MFEKFDITHVLKHGEALLGSSGQEYDVFDEELLGEKTVYNFKMFVSLNVNFRICKQTCKLISHWLWSPLLSLFTNQTCSSEINF